MIDDVKKSVFVCQSAAYFHFLTIFTFTTAIYHITYFVRDATP